MIEGQKDGVLNTLRESVALKIAGFLGISVLAACGTNSTEYTATDKPTISTSASETPIKTERISTPKINQKTTGISSVEEAVKILSKEKPVDLQDSSADFIALIEAANGNTAELSKFGTTIEDIAINYELNSLLLNKINPLLLDVEAEEGLWRNGSPDRLSVPAIIDDARAANFLLGKVITLYQDGALDLPSMKYDCPEPDNNSLYLSDGTESSYLLPPLGIFRYSGLKDLCSNLGKSTELFIQLYEETYLFGASQADYEGLPATNKAFTITANIATLSDPKASAIVTKYLSK